MGYALGCVCAHSATVLGMCISLVNDVSYPPREKLGSSDPSVSLGTWCNGRRNFEGGVLCEVVVLWLFVSSCEIAAYYTIYEQQCRTWILSMRAALFMHQAARSAHSTQQATLITAISLKPHQVMCSQQDTSSINNSGISGSSPFRSALAELLPPDVMIELCSEHTSVEVVERSLLRCCGSSSNNRMSVCSLASENWDLDALSGVSAEATTMDVEDSTLADTADPNVAPSSAHRYSTGSNTDAMDAMDVGLAIYDEPVSDLESMAG
jgi:hypothetical protein